MQTIALALLLLSWLNPLHIGPWISWHNEMLAFGAVCVLATAMLLRCRRLKITVRIPISAMIWPSLVAVVLLQYITGKIDYFGDALVTVFYLGLIFSAVILGFFQQKDHSIQRGGNAFLISLSAALLFVSALSTVVAFAQTLDVWQQNEWIARTYSLRRPGGNITQPNQLATLLLLGIVSLNYLYRRASIQGIAALILLGMLLAGLGLSESRSGVLGAISLLAFAVFLRYRNVSVLSVWQSAVGVLFLLLCFKFLPQLCFQIQNGGAITGPQISSNVSAGSRLVVWPQLIEASLQHPWLGWGLRQVPMAHNAVLHNYGVGEAFTYAHNVMLDLVLGVGYPLAIVVVILFMVWAVRRFQKINDLDSWYGMSLLIPLVVHSLFEFPFAYAYFLVPVALGVGFMEARLFPSHSLEIKWKFVLIGHSFFVLLLAWSVWEYIAVEEDFRVARFEQQRIGKTPSTYDRPHIVLLTQLDAMLTGIRLVPTPAMSTESIESARKVAMRFPWPATQNRYALSLALNGNSEEAIRQLKVIRAMHGDKTYQGIKVRWQELAHDKYPLLADIKLP